MVPRLFLVGSMFFFAAVYAGGPRGRDLAAGELLGGRLAPHPAKTGRE